MKDTAIAKEEEQDNETQLSKRFTEALENLSHVILAMDFEAQNESMRKCLEIGMHEDGLNSTFVCYKINQVFWR